MGADLFISSLYEAGRNQWKPELEKAANERDRLPEASPERAAVQLKVDYYLEQLKSAGYFRDPYNSWDLLWQFGLSWWVDVIPTLDDDGQLSVEQTERLLAMLREREDTFEARIEGLSLDDGRYFRRRYAEFRQFLRQAIALGEPIQCSL